MVILPEVPSRDDDFDGVRGVDAVEGRAPMVRVTMLPLPLSPCRRDGRRCDADEIDRYGEHGAQQDRDQEYLFHGCHGIFEVYCLP